MVKKQDVAELGGMVAIMAVLAVHQFSCVTRGTSSHIENIAFAALLLAVMLGMGFHNLNSRGKIRWQVVVGTYAALAVVFGISLIIKIPDIFMKMGLAGFCITFALFVLLLGVAGIMFSKAIDRERARKEELGG